MLLSVGARVTNVLAISTKNLDFTNRSVTFLVRKHKDKEAINEEFWHTVCLDMETLTELMAYIHTWSMSGYLFRPHYLSKQPMTRQAVSLKLKKLTEIAGITRHINVHMYRHGLAKNMQNQVAPAELIAFQLAHSSTQVTLETYARLDAVTARNMCESIGVRLRR